MVVDAEADVATRAEDVGLPVRLVLVIGALSAFGPLSMDMYLPSLPSLSRDLGASASQAQLTLTACLFGLAAGQVLAGPLSDTLGRRRPLLVGLVAYAAASALCAAAPSVTVLVVLRLIQGIAGAAGIVIARAAVRDLYTGTALARFFSFTMLVNGLAPILAPVVGGQLLRVTSWRGVFLFLGLVGVGLLVTAATGLRETLPHHRRQPSGLRRTLRTFRRLLLDRSFVGIALSAGFAFGAMFSYIAGSPFVLEDIYGVSPQVFSLIFASNALGIVVAGQVNARIVGNFGPRRLLTVGLLSSATGGLLLLLAVVTGTGLPGILPALFLVVASVGLISPNAAALALADHPQVAGSASALLGLLQYVVGAAAAPLTGLGGARSALPMALLIAVLGCGALATLTLLARPRRA
jgi:DHA1 family bicyclomycin/chloramphenicol resistance-like MFS transporter